MPSYQLARIVGPSALTQAESVIAPEQFRFRVLAEGDSWFSMADLPITVLSPSQLRSLQFPGDALLVNCAQPGDELRNMADLHNMARWSTNAVFRNLLRDGIGPGTDLILLSAGGNDLINAADELLLDFAAVGAGHAPAAYVDAAKMQRFIDDYIKVGFRTIVQWRDAPRSKSKNVPIVVHTYDYSMPRNAPAVVGITTVGPWLHPVMERKGIPVTLRFDLSKHLLDCLGDAIMQLQAVESLPHFYVINTRGVLTPSGADDAGPTADWINEIHASKLGYEKLYAQRWQPVLDRVLLG